MLPLLLLSTLSSSVENAGLAGLIVHVGQITWLKNYIANNRQVRLGTDNFRALKEPAKC